MALSLRKRLGRRTALPDQTIRGDENDASSSGSSLSSTANEPTKGPETGQQTIAQDDLSTTPPPNRKLRSSKDFSRDKTPPQSLLQKYQSKSAKGALPAVSATGAGNKGSGTGRKDSTVNEASVEAFFPSSTPKKCATGSQEAKMAELKNRGETRNVHGVEFDMVDQPSDHSTPKSNNVKTIRHGPTQGAKLGHRRTRSKARRDQRENAESMEAVLSDNLKALKLDTSLERPPLSVRKVERTPSPSVEDVDKDEYGKVDTSPPTLRLVNDASSSTNIAKTADTAPPPKKRIPHHERHAAIDHAISNIITCSPPPPNPDTAPSPETPQKQKNKSILKPTSSPDSANLQISVSPPSILPTSPPSYIFCSDKSSTSRPSEPWAWCKRWTCCSCGDRGGQGDCLGRWEERPAMTMAEQKVCSRLTCGHVRCACCRLEFRAR